jgi:hypothetical protein
MASDNNRPIAVPLSGVGLISVAGALMTAVSASDCPTAGAVAPRQDEHQPEPLRTLERKRQKPQREKFRVAFRCEGAASGRH